MSESFPTSDVLIIEDDPTVRSVMVRYLTHGGHAVDAASDGMAALDALATRRYRAMVCDIVMPYVNGEGILRTVRTVAPDQAERVLFVTGASQVPEKRFPRALRAPGSSETLRIAGTSNNRRRAVGRPPAPGTALT